MRLNSDEDCAKVSQKTGFAIFELPESDFSTILPKANHFKPNEKGIYAKEDIKAISALVHSKQHSDLVIVLENAETMNEPAANTFLKTLEEPNDHIHFVFLVKNASEILPTIKSRAHNYYLPKNIKISDPPQIDAKIIATAKQYLACKPEELPSFCTKIAKTKDDPRSKALEIVDAAIHLLYKSYFVTGNQQFLNKLNNLIETQENLQNNGHIKLQLMSGMLYN